jgi:hypothetical protein
MVQRVAKTRKKRPPPPVRERQASDTKEKEPTPTKALCAMKSATKRKTLELQVRVQGVWLTALVDSGAEAEYIDPSVVNKLKLPWKDKKDSYAVHNLEGDSFTYDDGWITREVDHLKVFINGKNQGVTFDIIPMRHHDIVLGYPWLTKYNPQFNWRTGQVHIDYDDVLSSDNEDDSDDERSPILTPEDSEGETSNEDTTETSSPPKGTQHKHQKGKKQALRRTIGRLQRQFTQMNKDLEEYKKIPEEERLKNVPAQYRIYEKLFAEELETGLPPFSRWDHKIDLIDGASPTFHPIFNLNVTQLQTLKEYITEMERKGYIRESTSSAGYPVMFVPKKNGKLRLVVDYRRLNEITLKDRTPLPLITELKDRLHGMKVFTALDLKGAYNLIRIKEGHEWKTAFRTKFGLYEYLVMPFGLTNAPATFQRMINNVLREHLDIFVVCYLDDILIFSETEEEHTEHVHKVLQALQDNNLLVEPEKSHFHVKEVEFLGHVISHNEIRMDPKKIAAVSEWKRPKNLKEVQAFLGFANYYRRFIKGFSGLAIPLTNLNKKGVDFRWNVNAEKAFNDLKKAILSEPVLATFDPEREIELETDASDFAQGAQIGQRDDDGMLHPIAFFSYKMHGAELNYPIYDKEFLAIVNAFKEFRHYLLGSKHKIKVYTDHKNISYFATTQQLSGRQLRYAEYLSEFDYVIIHRKGSENGRADAISRRCDFDDGKTVINDQLLHLTPEGHLKQKFIARAWKGQYPPWPEHLKLIRDDGPAQDLMVWARGRTGRVTYQNGRIVIPEHHEYQIVEDLHREGPHDGSINTLRERVAKTYVTRNLDSALRYAIKECPKCTPPKEPPKEHLKLLRTPEDYRFDSVTGESPKERYIKKSENGKIIVPRNMEEYLAKYYHNLVHDGMPWRAEAQMAEFYTMENMYGAIRDLMAQCPKCPKDQLYVTRTIAATHIVEQGNPLLKQIQEYNDALPEEERTNKQQVPGELQHQLVQEIHEHLLHGHQGVNKTLERVRTTYQFPRMKQVVKNVTNKCRLCKKTKAQRHKPYGELQPLPVAERPWDSITMDFITKLPLSEDPATGVMYDSILVIVDRLTKFSYFIPYQEATDAEQFAYIFLRNIVSTHGVPSEILSDRGPPFASKFWQALMDYVGLNHRLSTAFRPQTDGQTERTNQILEQYLRCYINYEQNDWVEKLPTAQLSYNTATHESTKLTPAYANFGFTPDAYRASRDGLIIPKAILTSENLKNLHEEMKTELEFVRNQMKKYYDKKRMKGPSFQEGDMVLLATKNIETKRQNKKLDYKYIGPYKIIEKISENNYRLDLPPKVRLHPVFHVSLLEDASNTIVAKFGNEHEIEVEGPEEYEVEKILDMRQINNKTEYLIKWKNYPESSNQWEPAKNLTHVQRLLKNFRQQHRKQARKDRSKETR